MKFSYYFKENILAYKLDTKEVYKVVGVKQLKESNYKLNIINSKKKNESIFLEKKDIKKFKFFKTKRMGKKTIQFEEVLSLLVENDSGTAFGDISGSGEHGQFSSDWYAPNDARNLYGNSPLKMQRRDLSKMEKLALNTRKKKKRKKKQKNAKKK